MGRGRGGRGDGSGRGGRGDGRGFAGSSAQAYIHGRRPTKEEENRKPPDTLDLKDFLAEADRAEVRRLQQLASGGQTAANSSSSGTQQNRW